MTTIPNRITIRFLRVAKICLLFVLWGINNKMLNGTGVCVGTSTDIFTNMITDDDNLQTVFPELCKRTYKLIHLVNNINNKSYCI